MQNIQNFPQNKVSPLVSFIVPCYNLPANMLCECLDSIFALSLSSTERQGIVVDDGSSQSPLAELSQYIDNIIYVRQPNKGLSAARNTGLSIAIGKFIQFVDGDDKIISTVYEQCLDIVRFKNPDVVLFDYTDNQVPQRSLKTPEPVEGTYYLANNNLHASAWGYIFKRNLLMGLRFTPGLLHEDEEFTPQLILRAEKVYSTDYKAYFYRKRTGSIMNATNKKHIIKRLNDFEHIIIHLRDIANTLPATDSLALQRRVAQLTMDYIYNIMTVSRSKKQLFSRIDRLSAQGLYPLPSRNYSMKYTWFRRLANTKTGFILLMETLIIANKR